MKYLTFDYIGKSASGKTDIWDVKNTSDSPYTLGIIAWKASWRKYCFFTYDELVLDEKCLVELATFCNDKTLEHKTAQIMDQL